MEIVCAGSARVEKYLKIQHYSHISGMSWVCKWTTYLMTLLKLSLVLTLHLSCADATVVPDNQIRVVGTHSPRCVDANAVPER